MTQRTHKLSYPTNNVRDANLIRPQTAECGDQRIPRVLTVDQLAYPSYQQVPVSIQTYNSDIPDHHKNLTFDPVTNRNRVIPTNADKWAKNKSTDKV